MESEEVYWRVKKPADVYGCKVFLGPIHLKRFRKTENRSPAYSLPFKLRGREKKTLEADECALCLY